MKSDFGQLCDMLYVFVYNDCDGGTHTIYGHERKLQHNVKIRFQFNDHHRRPFSPFAAAYTHIVYIMIMYMQSNTVYSH